LIYNLVISTAVAASIIGALVYSYKIGRSRVFPIGIVKGEQASGTSRLTAAHSGISARYEADSRLGWGTDVKSADAYLRHSISSIATGLAQKNDTSGERDSWAEFEREIMRQQLKRQSSSLELLTLVGSARIHLEVKRHHVKLRTEEELTQEQRIASLEQRIRRLEKESMQSPKWLPLRMHGAPDSDIPN
jgi:hypothetical protein